MNRLFKICIFLSSLFLIASLTPLRPAHAQAVFYKYVDKDGNIHFTDRLDSIPQEYRDQIKVYKGERKTKPVLSKEQGAIEEQNRWPREREEKKEAEEEALREKAAREEKLKERQEIQDRIAGLEDQVKAKQEEQASLWNSGMVNDRIRLNQLNGEISALVREIRSLQQELYEKEKE